MSRIFRLDRYMRVLALCFPVLLAGCAPFQIIECPGPPVPPPPAPAPAPSLRPEAMAPVGAALYSETNYWSKTPNRLLDSLRTPLGKGEVAVAAGDLVLKNRVNGRIAYCTEHPAYAEDAAAPPDESACFVDGDRDGRFETVTAPLEGRWLEKELAQPLRYARLTEAVPDTDSIRYELLYSGIGNGFLRMAYREYRNEIARPEAFLEVTYDYRQKPMNISFRGLRIHVVSADNNQITYRVLKGF